MGNAGSSAGAPPAVAAPRCGRCALLLAIITIVFVGSAVLVSAWGLGQRIVRQNEERAITALRNIHRNATATDLHGEEPLYIGLDQREAREYGYEIAIRDARGRPVAARPDPGGLPWVHIPPGRFRVSASPRDPAASGPRFFYVDHTGVIRSHLGAPASSADSPVE